ncbi:hypothetical protein MUG78_08625 [Gordonia alkaliphila]|uniref:hypothetical protein n=1 Tax=Gordonia alkaliphila TaxID=1053547 RepID=UPI001FF5ABBF|nr:hypothetical protein [Gordonia alkaliphila]MCK0439525.1 hypothetical protein [Gordonia alkaliphila]
MSDRPAVRYSRRRMFGGLVALAAAALLIVGSFLTWASASQTSAEEFEEVPMTVTTSATISGMGSVSLDLEVADAPPSFPQLDGAYLDQEASEGEEHTRMPGIWTVVFGALIAVGAVGLLVQRLAGASAFLVSLVALAALLAVIVFFTDPLAAVTSGSIGDSASGDFAAGVGLWLVLIGAVLGLVAGAVSVRRPRVA